MPFMPRIMMLNVLQCIKQSKEYIIYILILHGYFGQSQKREWAHSNYDLDNMPDTKSCLFPQSQPELKIYA